MKIGTRIKQFREIKGYSQQVVADHLSMTQANYHKLESDKYEIRLEYLEKLAVLYKVSLADLISNEKTTVNIQNNNHNHNGVVMGDPELFKNLLDSKNELLKLKDEKIVWLEQQLKAKSSPLKS
jgi:transcriptional regulator with XRE-family HTH domain